ncbi:MAG: AAA family ATPase [Lachnospiraceae bacterium]
MNHLVITITRQFGSLGRPIARRMSELLNIEYYDRDIVDATAKKMNKSVSAISDAEESARGAFFNMKFPLGTGTNSIQDEIFYTQTKIINEISDKESCIIVGRCSDYILQNRKDAIHIFIYAPVEERLKNCVDVLHMNPDEAKKMIKDVDKARESYHKHYAKYSPSDFRYKDIMIDSSFLGVEGTAQHLAAIIREKYDI